MSEENKENIGEETVLEQKPQEEQEKGRTERKISLSSFIFSAVALVVAAVMLTYAVCGSIYKERLAEAQLRYATVGNGAAHDSLELIEKLFEKYSYYGVDSEEVAEKVLKAYVEATGDVHAEYYNAEEFEAMVSDMSADYAGIGVTVGDTAVNYGGEETRVLEIFLVTPDGPAEKAGIVSGDLIYSAETDEGTVTVDKLGYDGAVMALKGAEGTVAKFTILRPNGNGGYTELPFSLERAKVASVSVNGRVSETDAKVGIVSLYRFDLQTPAQFKAAMDRLIGGGCEFFVFDLRNNLGGDLNSVVAVLSTFANEGDTIISIESKDGSRETITAKAVSYDGNYADCSVLPEDIGKYRKSIKDAAVICNGSTASAGELFTAALRDYNIAELVGTTTYGKGSVQQTIDLSQFGYKGALKLTTAHYFPPSGEGYHGVGIEPTLKVELSDDAKKYNLYKLPQSIDNQLAAAISTLDK
ncbi:MAG: hypothetical protein E7641_05815 [Ruminococcaceae bacterium]|nr:hypothetical protein [Oscillospiraceae bacterium]